MNIQLIIRDTLKKFKVIPYEINNGLCEEFAMEVIESMGGYQKDLFELTSDNFTDDNDEFKPEYLADYGDIDNPDPSEIDMGSHVWIYYNGKHYDAECVEGVENLFDLPFYKRRVLKMEKEDVKTMPFKTKNEFLDWIDSLFPEFKDKKRNNQS